ncbi:MAG: Ferritin, Dps family protein, partial [uncultured Solirubrobacteraceae bacterium]
ACRRLRRTPQRADRPRVRRRAAISRDRRLLRRRDASPPGRVLLRAGAGRAQPRADDDPVPARRGRAGAGPRRRGPAECLRRRRRTGRAGARAGAPRQRSDQRPGRDRSQRGRLLQRAVHAVVHQGADRGGRVDERPAQGRHACPREPAAGRGVPRPRGARRRGRRPDGTAGCRRSAV